jgi:drug/metabolite transporter (DMT)-like permease
MRPLQIAGLVLIAIGVWFIVRPPNYSSDEKVFKLGNIEAQMRRERSVPGWVGGIAVGAGAVLVVVGLKRR